MELILFLGGMVMKGKVGIIILFVLYTLIICFTSYMVFELLESTMIITQEIDTLTSSAQTMKGYVEAVDTDLAETKKVINELEKLVQEQDRLIESLAQQIVQ